MLREQRENREYLSGVELPRELRIESADGGVARADYVFLSVPSMGLGSVIEGLRVRLSKPSRPFRCWRRLSPLLASKHPSPPRWRG